MDDKGKRGQGQFMDVHSTIHAHEAPRLVTVRSTCATTLGESYQSQTLGPTGHLQSYLILFHTVHQCRIADSCTNVQLEP